MPLNLIFAVTLIGFIGVNASRVVLQLYSLELGATPTQVGMLVALYYVCPLLLSYPAGTGATVTDRCARLFSARSAAPAV